MEVVVVVSRTIETVFTYEALHCHLCYFRPTPYSYTRTTTTDVVMIVNATSLMTLGRTSIGRFLCLLTVVLIRLVCICLATCGVVCPRLSTSALSASSIYLVYDGI